MCMATKAELSEEINETLGTNIDWSRLYEDDVTLLNDLVKSGDLLEPMAKHMVKEHGKEKLDEKIDDWRPGMIIERLI